MTKLNLALCQMNVIDNKLENLKKASSMISDASKKVDFVVLPEIGKAKAFSSFPFVNVDGRENDKRGHQKPHGK
jgi:hypothetical protein